MLRETVPGYVRFAIGCDIFIGDMYATIGILRVVQLGVMSEEIPKYSVDSGVQAHASWRFIEIKGVGLVVSLKLVALCFVREICSEDVVVQLAPRDKAVQFTWVNLGQLVVCDNICQPADHVGHCLVLISVHHRVPAPPRSAFTVHKFLEDL
jgi:hypothetical protein